MPRAYSPARQTQNPRRALARAMRTTKVPAISRAAAVLRLVGKSDHPMGVHEIARALEIVPSTCLNILRALVAEELVAFDPFAKRYSLDAGILTLGRNWLRQNRFTELAQPLLDQISLASSVTAMAVRIVGLDHIIVVALSHSRQAFQVSADIGSRFPALISATGRCIAAFQDHPREEIESRLAQLHWDDAPSLDKWWKEVEETRKRGFAIDDGNYISGVTILSAPVLGPGQQLHHALIAIGIGAAFREQGPARVTEQLLSAAASLSQQSAGG